MRGELLLDTGALVSLLDRSQTHHLKCRRAFADWTGPVVSTEAVLTGAMVPFVEDEHTVFLRTIIPSRKATKQYLGEESDDHED